VIRVEQARLEEVRAEAVVRPIRSDLAPVTAASRDVATAAGPGMEARLAKLGSLPLGGAVMTPAGELPCDFVIHAVVMSEEEPQTTVTVQRALRNGLARAVDWGVTSLAVPPLGMGVGLTDPEQSAQALVELLFAHLDEGRAPLDLTIVVTSSFEEELFRRLVEAAAKRER
jgi:O-acetyl-ADP-ribose deacetylase (regulator of RNase III)